MKTLRTAVIGLGRIGWQFHVPQVAAQEGFDLVAVVEPLQERRDEARIEYDVVGYATCDELLAAEDLDLVVIASPTHFHVEQALAAFAGGCDVFCDKPIAPTLAGADRMIEAMREYGRKLMVYQPHRAGAEVVALREILRQGLIGPVYMFRRARTGYDRRNDWQAFRAHGGGMLNNYGAHYIDQLLHLSGSRAVRISCALRTVASLGDAEDVVKAVIETADGTILDLDINIASAHPMPPWQILGKCGSIVLDEAATAWRVRFYREEELGQGEIHLEFAAPDRKYGNREDIPWQEAVFPIADDEAVDFYRECYAYFALDEEPFVPVEETREVMRVLDVCRRNSYSAGGVG